MSGVAVPASQAGSWGAGGRILAWRSLTADGIKRYTAFLTLLGWASLLLGPLVSDKSSDVLAALIAFAGVQFFLRFFVSAHELPAGDKEWLLRLCQAALLLRVCVAHALFFGPWDQYALGDDQVGYDFLPQVVARSWASGTTLPAGFLSAPSIASRIGYYLFVAGQFYVLGPCLIVPRIVNSLAGALIAFYSYQLGGRVFGTIEGKVTAVGTAFFPSLVLWSCLNMRDIWLALSVLVIIWHAVLLRDKLSTASIGVIVGHLIWLQYNRSYLVLVMAAATGGVFLVARSKQFLRDVAVGVFFLGVLVLLYQQFGLGQDSLEWLDLQKISAQRGVVASSDVGRSGYLGNVDLSNPVVLALFLPLGVAYFLFSPFPWQMTAFRRLITLPEMLVWYWTVPYVWYAARRVWRERSGRQLALLLPLLVITLVFSVTSSNIGLAYRYRVQIIALYLAFGAAGLVRRRAAQAEALLRR